MSAVQEELQDLLGRDDVDVVIFCGGTGFSPKDLTVDAVRPFLEREVEGFGELFRALSCGSRYVGHALASFGGRPAPRGVLPAGLAKAVKLAVERLILPELSHLLGQVRRDV